MTGQVVSLPKRRRRKWRRQALTAIGSGFILWGLYLLVSAPWWQIGDIRVLGVPREKARQIHGAILRLDVIGQPLFRVDPRAVEQVVASHDWVHQAEVRRWLFPARLDVYLSARSGWTRLIWQGKTHTIGEDGGKIQGAPRLPLLFQLDRQRPTVEQLACMHRMADAWRLKQLEGHGVYQVTDPKRIVWFTGRETVWLGNTDQLPAKLAAYQRIKPLAKAKGKRLEYIDLRWWQNPVLKVRL